MSRHIFVMPMLFSMTPLHLLGHNDQDDVDMTLCICDAIGTSDGITWGQWNLK